MQRNKVEAEGHREIKGKQSTKNIKDKKFTLNFYEYVLSAS